MNKGFPISKINDEGPVQFFLYAITIIVVGISFRANSVHVARVCLVFRIPGRFTCVPAHGGGRFEVDMIL